MKKLKLDGLIEKMSVLLVIIHFIKYFIENFS